MFFCYDVLFFTVLNAGRSPCLSFYLGFLNLGSLPGCVGAEDGRKTGKRVRERGGDGRDWREEGSYGM